MIRMKTCFVVLLATGVLGGTAVAPASAAAPADAASSRAGAAAILPAERLTPPVSRKLGGAPPTVPGRGALPDVKPLGDYDGSCDGFVDGTGDVCFFFRTEPDTSIADFYRTVPDLNAFTFLTPGMGQGLPVAHNFTRVVNIDQTLWVRLYTGTDFTGTHIFVSPGGFIDLPVPNDFQSFDFCLDGLC